MNIIVNRQYASAMKGPAFFVDGGRIQIDFDGRENLTVEERRDESGNLIGLTLVSTGAANMSTAKGVVAEFSPKRGFHLGDLLDGQEIIHITKDLHEDGDALLVLFDEEANGTRWRYFVGDEEAAHGEWFGYDSYKAAWADAIHTLIPTEKIA